MNATHCLLQTLDGQLMVYDFGGNAIKWQKKQPVITYFTSNFLSNKVFWMSASSAEMQIGALDPAGVFIF